MPVYKLIACEILYREVCAVVAGSANRIDVEFMPKGLHDTGQPGMFKRLDETLRAVDESDYDAVLFGYGLCSNGLVGLAARSVPLVVPRAHDCITLFLGDKQRYLDYFHGHPSVYYKTSGWIERGSQLNQLSADTIQSRNQMTKSYEELVEKYGEDNARFLYEQFSDLTHNCSQLTYIAMGIEPDDRFEQHARQEAQDRQWRFERLAGDMSLIRELVDGPWDDDRFLVVPPGCSIAASYDDGVIRAEGNV